MTTARARQRTATIRMVPPEEYRTFRYPDYPQAKNPDSLVRHFRKTSPEYYEKIKKDVQDNGFTTPALVRWTDPRGNPLRRPEVMEGHHRAAVAHELGVPLPVGDYDDEDDFTAALRAGQSWWRENQRPTDDQPGHTARVMFHVKQGGHEYVTAGYADYMADMWRSRGQDDRAEETHRRLSEARGHHPGEPWYSESHMGNRPEVGWVRTDRLAPYRERRPGDWHLDEQESQAIADDLTAGHGFHSPAILRYNPDNGLATLAEGNHRLRAAELAGVPHVPVVVQDARRGMGSDVEPHHPVPGAPGLPGRRDAYHPRTILPADWLHPETRTAARRAVAADEVLLHRGVADHDGRDALTGVPHPTAEAWWEEHQEDRPGFGSWWDPDEKIAKHYSESNGRNPSGVIVSAYFPQHALVPTDATGVRVKPNIPGRVHRVQRHVGNGRWVDMPHSPGFHITAAASPTGHITSTLRPLDSHEKFDDFIKQQFGPRVGESGKQMPHPRTGWDVKVGEHRLVARPPEGEEEGKPMWNITDYGQLPNRPLFPRENIRQEPIEHVYRGVSHDEWQQARERGYLRSDQRGTIADWEGTNAATDPRSSVHYLPSGTRGHVLKIRVRPEDQWFTRHEDPYIRTRNPIPLDRVEHVTPPIHIDERGRMSVEEVHAARPHTAAISDWSRPALPAEQEDALNDPDHRQYKRQLLDLAKDPVPGTHLWRGEVRHRDDLDRPPSVGMHWTVNPNQVTAPYDVPPEHHRVMWQAHLEHPAEQIIPRGHPIWSGRGQSMDAEAEVRLRPGAHIRLNRRYVYSGDENSAMPIVRYPERSQAGWTAYEMDHPTSVAHQPLDDMINYQERHPDLFRNAAFLPTQRLFGPTYGLDHRLFEGDHLKGSVREYIISTLSTFWEAKFGECGWEEWAIVYLAGSEASEWTSPELEGNNDFDVLIGVDYTTFRSCQSRTSVYQTMSDQDITDDLNRDLRLLDEQTAQAMIPTGGGQVSGPFSATWYVNPHSYDIRRIKPYAAYDVTHDRWAVTPPHLPEWGIAQFPEGPALLRESRAVAAYVRAILALPEPYRTQQGNALWHHLHSDRGRAFTEQGEGWYDPGNVIEKYLDQAGLWSQLVQVMVRARQHPETLQAPADWSNDPLGV